MLDLQKYISRVILSGSIVVYDYFIDGKKSTQYIKDDFYYFALSNVFGLFTSDILFDVLNINKSGVYSMLSDPLLSGLLYMYMYQSMIYPKYTQAYGNQRSSTYNFMLASSLNIITSFLNNPLISLFSGYKLY